MQNPPKHPPHDLEAEMSALGGMMLDNRMIDEVLDTLREVDFYTARHQLIFRCLVELHTSRMPCDFITMQSHLAGKNLLDQVGGVAYLGSLVNDTPSAANVRAYAGIVRERSVLRQLIAVGQETAEMGFRPEGRSSAELLEESEKKIFALRQTAQVAQGVAQAMPTLLAKAMQTIEGAMSSGGRITGLATGFEKLDWMLNGLHPGDLFILAGRPSMGKTSLAMNIAQHVGSAQKRVAVFSMEMPADQLVMRMMACHARVKLQDARLGLLEDSDFRRLDMASNILHDCGIVIDDASALTPMELRARARRLKAKGGLDLIVIDYLQLMTVPGSENRTNEIGEISRSLKALAKDLSVPVIALSQLNRGVEARNDKRPRMSDLRESGQIEQDADVVAFVYRDEVYNPHSNDKGIAEIIIGKQRNGPLGTAHLAFHGEYTAFENLQFDYEYRAPEVTKTRERGFSPRAAPPSHHETADDRRAA